MTEQNVEEDLVNWGDDPSWPEEDDCFQCGQCDGCVERSRAWAEEMEGEPEPPRHVASGVTADGTAYRFHGDKQPSPEAVAAVEQVVEAALALEDPVLRRALTEARQEAEEEADAEWKRLAGEGAAE